MRELTGRRGRLRLVAAFVIAGLVTGLGFWAFRAGGSEVPTSDVVGQSSKLGDSGGSQSGSPARTASPRPEVTEPGVSTAAPTPVPTPSASRTAPTTGPHPTARPVPLDATARPAAEVVARLSSIDAVTASAELPGEIGGPGLEVRLEITNGTASDLDLAAAVVNLYHGRDHVPATPIDSESTRLPANAGPSRAAKASYVFRVPVEERENIQVEVDLGIGRTVVLFEGRAPR